MTTAWDAKTLAARIESAGQHRRFAAGSPDPIEIAAYASSLPPDAARRAAVILGMTPELRCLAADRFSKIVSIDCNPQAIALYRDWLSEPLRNRETIIEGNWMDLPRQLGQRYCTILGDGVFGNLPDLAAHHQLLSAIAASLHSGGRLITRMAMIPAGFDPAEHTFDRLLARFRAGEIDEAEFGFGVRLVGHFACCYEPSTFILDNAKLFDECAQAHRLGCLTDHEHALIRRYYFGCRNCILSQEAWENCLETTDFTFRKIPCRGKTWYTYYMIYECILNNAPESRFASPAS